MPNLVARLTPAVTAALPFPTRAIRTPPPGPIDTLADGLALEGWRAPLAANCRRLGQPAPLLRVKVVPVSPANASIDAASQGLLVQACAYRVRASVRATDHVARVGGHALAVLLTGADEAGTNSVAERLVHACQGPYRIGAHRLSLRVLVDIEPVRRQGQTPGQAPE